jgi:hypothetical protein
MNTPLPAGLFQFFNRVNLATQATGSATTARHKIKAHRIFRIRAAPAFPHHLTILRSQFELPKPSLDLDLRPF